MGNAVTEKEALEERRQEEYKSNLDATADVDRAEQTASHETKLPSEIDALATRRALSNDEAETVFDAVAGGADEDAAVADVVAARTIYRKVIAETPAGIVHPTVSPVVPAAPVPPPVEYLDPAQPRPEDPTGLVIKDHESPNDAVKLADQFEEQAHEVAESVRSAASDLEDSAGSSKGLTAANGSPAAADAVLESDDNDAGDDNGETPDAEPQ